MKVLMLLHNLRVSSGVSSYVMNYFRAIDHSKIHMDFAIWRDIQTPYYDEIKAEGSTVYVLPPMKKINAHIKECEKIISEGKYDIIHDNTLYISYPIMCSAKKYKVPVRMLHSHNSKLGETKSKDIRNRAFLPLLKYTATDYAACSKLAAQALIGNNSYDFIPNIVSGERLNYSLDKRNEIRKAMGAEGKIIIGSIGRVAAQKNPLFALDVIKEIVNRNQNVEYWWIGSGPMDDELKKGVIERKLDARVRILGSREDVPDLLQAMDIFFLPSLFEGLPITGVEAQAAGLPSVISASVTPEVVYTDLVEFVSLEKPIETWAEALERQITRVPDRRSYIGELRNSPFSEIKAGEHLTQIYEKLVQKAQKS